jgi:hypothetical protein
MFKMLVELVDGCCGETDHSKSTSHPVATAAASKHFTTFSVSGFSEASVGDRM